MATEMEALEDLVLRCLDGCASPDDMATLNRALSARPDVADLFVSTAHVDASLQILYEDAAPAQGRVVRSRARLRRLFAGRSDRSRLVPIAAAAAAMLALIIGLALRSRPGRERPEPPAVVEGRRGVPAQEEALARPPDIVPIPGTGEDTRPPEPPSGPAPTSPPPKDPAPSRPPAPPPQRPIPDPAPETVTATATVESVQGDVYVLAPQKSRIHRGHILVAGQGLAVEGKGGRAIVKYADGTRLDVGTDSVLRSLGEARDGAKLVVLERGTLAAEVVRQPVGRPMVLRTPLADATVLGTRLTLVADPGGTQLEVKEGKVRLVRSKDGRSIEVATGQYAVAAPGAPLLAHRAPGVASFTLINADTDQPIDGFEVMKDGAVLNLSKLPTRNLNLRANTAPQEVGCVQFGLDDDPLFNTERSAPYALVPSSEGYSAWTPSPGWHTVTATPFTGPPAPGKRGGTGTAGTSLKIRFQVVDR